MVIIRSLSIEIIFLNIKSFFPGVQNVVQGVDSKAGEGDVASTPCPLCRIEREASH